MHGFLYLLDSYFLGCFIPRAIHPASQPASLASHSAKQVTRLPYAQPRHRVSCRVRLCKVSDKNVASNRASPANQSREEASQKPTRGPAVESGRRHMGKRPLRPGRLETSRSWTSRFRLHMYVEQQYGLGKNRDMGFRSGSRLGKWEREDKHRQSKPPNPNYPYPDVNHPPVGLPGIFVAVANNKAVLGIGCVNRWYLRYTNDN